MKHREGQVRMDAMSWLGAAIIVSTACAARGGSGASVDADVGGATAARISSHRVSPADSALIGRILLAEDRRDSTDRALVEARAHADPMIRVLAVRAMGRIRDPRFVARDSLPPL